jgi:hypothetical protein
VWGDDIKLRRRGRLLEVEDESCLMSLERENTFEKMVGMVIVMKVTKVSSQAAALEDAGALESVEKSI